MTFQFIEHATLSSHYYWESDSLAKDVSTHDINIHKKTTSSVVPAFKKDKMKHHLQVNILQFRDKLNIHHV